MTQNGFTQNNSKGLFTFYKEQQMTKQFKYKPNNKDKKHHESLSNPTIKKSVDKLTSKSVHEQLKGTSRYKEEQQLLKKHQIYTSKHVFSLKFNSPRKNGYYMQLTAARHHRSKTETQNRSGRQIIAKLNNKFLVGELSVREMRMKEFKQLFIPKKEYLSQNKRSPMKINQVIGRLFEEETKTRDQLGLRRFNQEVSQVKSSRRSIKQGDQANNKGKLSNYLFKDVLQLRKKKLQNHHFWEQIKQKCKGKASRVNISKRVEQWIKGNNLNQITQNHMPSIKKIIFSINQREDPQQSL